MIACITRLTASHIVNTKNQQTWAGPPNRSRHDQAPRLLDISRLARCAWAMEGALNFALSRRKQGFESPRERFSHLARPNRIGVQSVSSRQEWTEA
jgi:hypothetical protein